MSVPRLRHGYYLYLTSIALVLSYAKRDDSGTNLTPIVKSNGAANPVSRGRAVASRRMILWVMIRLVAQDYRVA
jgi:hypothetical protein